MPKFFKPMGYDRFDQKIKNLLISKYYGGQKKAYYPLILGPCENT
jgi:hypothetical protein